MSVWPQISWAMCGGMPFMTASVTKILPEVVRGEAQRLPGGVGEPGAGEGVLEQRADGGGADRPVLHADPALEQQRHRRVPDPFVES